MKRIYIAPITENVFPEPLMEGMNPGSEGGILLSGSNVKTGHEIVAPVRRLYV